MKLYAIRTKENEETVAGDFFKIDNSGMLCIYGQNDDIEENVLIAVYKFDFWNSIKTQNI